MKLLKKDYDVKWAYLISILPLGPGSLVSLPPRESAVLREEADDGLRLYPRASLKPIKYHQQDTRNIPVKVRSRTSQGQVRSSQDQFISHFIWYISKYIKCIKLGCMKGFGDTVFCTHRNRIANASHHADVFRGQIMNWKISKVYE